MNITELTVHELIEKLKKKELTVTEITNAYIDRINEKEPQVEAVAYPDISVKKLDSTGVEFVATITVKPDVELGSMEKLGVKKEKVRKMFPGYVLVKMIYGDDLWHDVTRTPSIIAFVGPNARAIPLSDEEVARLGLETQTFVNQDINVGDNVEVLTGSFMGTVATVESVDNERKTCKIKVVMFNRDNEVELDFAEVKKL